VFRNPAAGWQLDHVFVFVAPGAPEAAALKKLGLAESFRRPHPGQGTANACFCFDNAYLELLWIADAGEATACPLARAGLAERADWRRSGASPFGIALRHPDPVAAPSFPCWNYAAPFLPAGMTIPVATASDDPRQPLLFRSPGNARPDQWIDGRAGGRQRAAGLAEIAGVWLAFPDDVTPDPVFDTLAACGLIALDHGAVAPTMELDLSRADGGARTIVRLPDCIFM
jgi:hypothetical protein